MPTFSRLEQVVEFPHTFLVQDSSNMSTREKNLTNGAHDPCHVSPVQYVLQLPPCTIQKCHSVYTDVNLLLS
jgi:hypothetical protein